MSTVISGSTYFSPSLTSSESGSSSTSSSSSGSTSHDETMDVPLRSSVGVDSDSSRSSSSTVSSLMELGWAEEEHFTVERIQRTKRQLEDEIEVREIQSVYVMSKTVIHGVDK